MKRSITIFVLTCLLLGCSPQIVPTPTAEPTHTPTPSKTITPTKALSPTPPVTWTPAPTHIPDIDCSDTETFDPTISIYRDNAGLTRLGNGQLYGVDWSKDGTRIAIGSESGIHIFDAQTMQQVKYIETPHTIEFVRFSPNGKWIATDDYSQVAIWDVETAKLIAQLGENIHFHSSRWVYPSSIQMGNISFHPNGKQVVLHSMNYLGMDSTPTIEIWDIETQKLVREWKTDDKDFVLPDAIFSPNGKWIASRWKDGITIWDAQNGEVVKHIKSDSRHLSFSPDGQKFVMSEYDSNVVSIFDIQGDESTLITVGEGYEPVTGIISADGKKLITQYSQNREPYGTPISIWSLDTGDKLLDLNMPDFALGMAINPMQNELVTIGYTKGTDKTQNIRIWDIETGALLREQIFSQPLASDIALSPNGSRLIAEKNDHFHIYNTQTGGYLCMLPEPIKRGYHLSFRADGKKFAYINPRDNTIVWDIETGKAEQIITQEQLESQKSPVNGPLSYKKTPFTYKSGPDYVWNLVTWGWKNANGIVDSWIINTCDAATSIPSDCPGAVSPNQKLVIRNDGQKDMAILNTSTQAVLQSLDKSHGATNFTFSPDSLYIVLLNYLDWTMSVWDAKTYQRIAIINSGLEGEGPILGNQEFSFSADGKRLATYLPYFPIEGVRIWNTKTWKMEKSFDTKGGVGDVAISGDGKVVVGLSGYVIYFWRLEDKP